MYSFDLPVPRYFPYKNMICSLFTTFASTSTSSGGKFTKNNQYSCKALAENGGRSGFLQKSGGTSGENGQNDPYFPYFSW